MNEIDERQQGDGASTVLNWYDFICPFCYVAQHRTAILIQSGLQVVELPFQIHPEIPPEGIAMGPRRGPMYAMLEQEAKEAGLLLHWPSRLPDTRRALAVAEWVRRHETRAFPQLHRQLFEAHFVMGENLGDAAVIDRHARGCGVDLVALHTALTDGSAQANVAASEAMARRHGVRGTPAWLLPQGLIDGLRPAAEFEQLAEQAPPFSE